MADLSLEQRIAFAAIQYDRARCDVQRIARQRAAFLCARAECAYESRHPDQYTPCWKNYRDTYDGDHALWPESEWCASCRQRQAVQLDYRKATVKRGARLRELHRLCELSGGWHIAPDIKLLSIREGFPTA